MDKRDKPRKRRFSFDKLEKVESGLYQRAAPSEAPEEETVGGGPGQTVVPSQWREDPAPPSRATHFRINVAIMKRIFWGALIFFVLAAGISAYMFFGGANRISTNNVDIMITGPTSVGAGEPLSYSIQVNNRNNAALQGVTLLVQYPPGTHTADASQAQLLRDSEDISDIPAGGSIVRNKQAVLFGEANTSEHIIVSVEYRVQDSSATYFKEQHYDVLISSSPVSLKINSVTEAVSGNQVDIAAQVTSNSTSVISGLMLQVDYPYGFTYSNASPAPTYGNSVFLIGDLAPAAQRVIHIIGTVNGQAGETRDFRFNLGLPGKNNNQAVGTVFLTDTQTIALQKPFVSVDLSLSGSSNDTVAAQAGQTVQGSLAWANNLPSRIINLDIEAKLSGSALDRLSVGAGQGFWRSADNTIVWDKTTTNQFAVVGPNDNGILTFSLAPLPLSTLLTSGAKNSEISVDVTAKAQRLTDANTPEDIVASVSKNIRISSNVSLAAQSLYFTGPFSNQGPVPPKADQNTTYTITWTLTNTLNDLANATVDATLPGYVTWLGNVSPSGEAVTYDQQSRQVEWDAGDVSAGTGYSTPPRSVSFQVSVVPSLSQLGSSPALVNTAVVTATDRWSNATLTDSAKAVTTQIADPQNQSVNYGKVVQ